MIKDNKKNGIVIGVLAPFLGFFIYYLLRFRLFTLQRILAGADDAALPPLGHHQYFIDHERTRIYHLP
jgi:hypothetical protein